MYGKGKITLLKDEALKNGININTLADGSHKKVPVKCDRCGEIFDREFRYLHQLHNCPTHVVKNGIKLKWCNKCKEFKEHDEFGENKNRHDMLNSYCHVCVKKRSKSVKLDFNKWLKRLYFQKKSNSKKYKYEFDLTYEHLLKLWKTQDGKCFYSGVDLEFGTKSLFSANLDRCDSNKGYTKNNVVWSSKGFNNLKNNSPLNEFYNFLSKTKALESCRTRAECKLINKDAKLPFRKRDTDAGYDISSVEDIIIPSQGMADVSTGIILSVPRGWYLTVDGRSSMSVKGLIPFRGIIDATYCGELKVALMNISNTDYKVKKFDRIAQIILHKQHHIDVQMVEEFSQEYNERGTLGFGSTGR